MRSWARLMIVAAAALLASTLVAPPASASTQPTGPDVSRWQHPAGAPIDWAKVRRAGHSFAIIKATESTSYANPFFAADASGARAAHLIVGAYAFARPSLPVSSAATQARYFVQRLGSARSAGTLPPILDLESSGGLSPADLITWTQQFLETVRAVTGRTPIIYSYPYFWSTQMAGSTAFSRYPLWLASYRSTTPPPFAGWSAWTLWQYTSSGTVPGIRGSVDLSRFKGSMAQLASLANGTVSRAWVVTAPSAPVHVSATAGSGSATVRWQPTDDGGQLPSFYTITASPGGAAMRVAGSSTAATVTRLTAGTSYRFTVVATNRSGRSAPSAPSGAVVPAASPSPPPPPSGVVATVSSGRVALHWIAAAGAPTSYLIYRCTPAPCTPAGSALATVPSSSTSYTDTTAVNGTRYAYAVATRNRWGTSRPGAAVTAMPVAVPAPPTGLSATARATTVILRWGPPSNSGGSAVTAYLLTVDGRPVLTLDGAVRSNTVSDLSRGTAHTFKVAARNSFGSGPTASTTLAPVMPVLSASVSPTSTPSGHSVVMTGQTSPLFAGERIYRQGFYSNAWHTWASTVISTTGTYRFVITPTVVTLDIYRVILPASILHAAGASPHTTLRVT